MVVHYLLTGAPDLVTFTLPLPPHTRYRTLYVVAGWLLEWINLGAAVALLALLVLAPRRWMSQWAIYRRDSGGGERLDVISEQQ